MALVQVITCDACGATLKKEEEAGSMRAHYASRARVADLCHACWEKLPGREAKVLGRPPKRKEDS